MVKTIETLIADIYSVVEGKGGWDKVINDGFTHKLGETISDRFNPKPRSSGTLRMSNLGTDCERKLWYDINEPPTKGSGIPSSTRLLFLYGDILEDLLISLCIAAGHEVTGEQGEITIGGIKGHRDCVIDGVTVDIKSASPYSFAKFRDGTLGSNDPFGYISQLSSYVYGGRTDTLVRDKDRGAFLVVNKVNGELCLDIHDLSIEVLCKEQEVQGKKDMIKGTVPARAFEPTKEGYYKGPKKNNDFRASGNMEINRKCTFCNHKIKCFPNLKSYDKGHKIVHLTEVVKVPYSRNLKGPYPELTKEH